jgi:hypothetical protein
MAGWNAPADFHQWSAKRLNWSCRAFGAKPLCEAFVFPEYEFEHLAQHIVE